MRRILCLWLPNWPVQRLVAARPELHQRALVLYAQRPRQGERVVACCDAAQSRGIRLDMPMSEAAAMAAAHLPLPQEERRGQGKTAHLRHAAPDLHCEPHDPQADRAALELLADACDRFSPLVGLETSDEPDCLLLDITGLGPLFGGEESLADQLAHLCRQRGYRPHVAVADTVGAAWALAHFGTPLTIVPPGQAAHALAPLPVAALRAAEETVALLRSLGIVFIAQLVNLPRESLQSRFGVELVQRLDQALGTAAEVIVARHSAPEPAAVWPLEYPTAHRETLRQVLALLIRRVAEPLAARGQGVLELAFQLDCSGQGSSGECSSGQSSSEQGVSLHVGLFQPTASAEHLLELVDMQLELLRLPGPVSRVAVWGARTAPLVERQHELFADAPRERQRQLAVLVDRLSSRLGQEQVVRSRLRAEAQPEAAFRYEPLTKAGASPSAARRRPSRYASSRRASSRRAAPSQESMASAPVAPRPLRLFTPPLPLEVVAVVPEGPPARIRFAGQCHPLARHWGPERIETAWWRGRSVRRDYYRVETVEGSRFWVFRRLTDGQWFLHGEFE